MATVFVDMIHTETGVLCEVPEDAVAFWLTMGYELAPEDDGGLSEQPFPYVRRISNDETSLSGDITVEQLVELLGAGIGTISDASVEALRAALVGSAPELLNTIAELSAALGDDENFATNVFAAIAAIDGGGGSSYVPTFGDLFDPALPSKAPQTKVVATVTNSAYDGFDSGGNVVLGPALPDVIDFNGTPVAYGSAIKVDDSGLNGFKPLDIETVFVGKYIAFVYATATPTLNARVWVDDEEIDMNPLVLANGLAVINLKFAVYGTYRIRICGQQALNYVVMNRNMSIRKPRARRVLGVISDSMFEGIAASAWADSNPTALRTTTGWKIWNMAQLGTGYIAVGIPGTTTPYGSADRIARVAAAPIDALLVNGTVNDGGHPAADVYDAMVAYFAAIKAVRPDLPIVVSGLEAVYVAGYDFTAVVAAQVAACADSDNVVGFINPWAEDWLTGTGDEAVPDDNGNQDFLVCSDGTHSSARGAMWNARLIAERMYSIPARLS